MHHHLPQTAKQGLQHAMQRKPMHCFGANAVPFSAGPHNMQVSCTSTLTDPVRKANVPYFFLTFAPCYHSCHLTQQRWKGWWEAAQACLSCSLHTRCKKLPDIWSWARQARSCSIFSCSCNLIALQVHTKRQPCKERKKKKMTAPFCITSKRSQVLFRAIYCQFCKHLLCRLHDVVWLEIASHTQPTWGLVRLVICWGNGTIVIQRHLDLVDISNFVL